MTNTPPNTQECLTIFSLAENIETRFTTAISTSDASGEDFSVIVKDASTLPALCEFLFREVGCLFGGLIVEERKEWHLLYLFLQRGIGWIHVKLQLPIETSTIPGISPQVHAADWYEREAADLFGLRFEPHPRLGDFILHDQVWQEGLAPLRRSFDPLQSRPEWLRPNQEWKPTLVVKDPGAFAMPVGPVYEGGLGESVHFLLETVGEDVVRAAPRLFYKYRAVEKIAEGKTVADGLLLAERFAAKSAFAHSMAYCQAVERATNVVIPVRARQLRVMLSELERLRHHAGTIEAICQSTALSVSEAQAAIIEEHLLRASCCFTGHRYLFGLNTTGGLRRDFDASACGNLLAAVDDAAEELQKLENRLRYTSSFLDRLEDAGIIALDTARDLDLAGPVGRASGLANDLRSVCPYGGYPEYEFEAACEKEGDGYARLRVLFYEALQSSHLIRQAIENLQPGEVCAEGGQLAPGATIGWAEAPIGAAIHWLRLDENERIERYRILSPSFRNWLGLHVAVENFAFQDFPIILATFGLSATECDR